MSPLLRLLLALTAAAALTAPATAHAGAIMLGSDLSADATLTESHPRDWAAWPTVQATEYGEVSTVQLKGTVRKPDNDGRYGGRYPPFNFVVVVLRPQSSGAVTLTGVSGDLFALPGFPFGKPADTITTYNLQDYESRVCVEPGDYVGIATSGGFGNSDPAFGGFPDDFYVDGYPVQMFGRVAASSTNVFEQPANGGNDGNGFQAGDTEMGTAQQGRELLMRVTVKTERDARYTCWSPQLKAQSPASGPNPKPPERAAAEFGEQSFKQRLSSASKINVQLACVSKNKPCQGQVYFKHDGKPVGVGALSLAAGAAGAVPVQVNANGLRLLKQRKGKLKVTAIVRIRGGDSAQRGFKLVRR